MLSPTPVGTREYEQLLGEHSVTKQKLDSKLQALLIINKELEQCRNERDHYKAMIEQLKPDRYSPAVRSTADKSKDWLLDGILLDSRRCKGTADQVLAQHVCEMREENKRLSMDVQDLNQKLQDAEGDCQLLRDCINRQNSESTGKLNGFRQFTSHERERMVERLESLKVKYMLLEKDVQTILDEKAELITERDAYKHKVDRLNHELNFALKGDEKRVFDIDSILMENRYLQERLKQTQEEKSLYLQTLSKYKNILEKRKNRNALKLGSNGTSGVIITHKQVEQMLQNTSLSQLPATQATIADLRSLALALFESLNDKNIALSHQKKANKILGHRLAELEKKLSSMELSSSWELTESIVMEDVSNDMPAELDKKECESPLSKTRKLLGGCHTPIDVGDDFQKLLSEFEQREDNPRLDLHNSSDRDASALNESPLSPESFNGESDGHPVYHQCLDSPTRALFTSGDRCAATDYEMSANSIAHAISSVSSGGMSNVTNCTPPSTPVISKLVRRHSRYPSSGGGVLTDRSSVSTVSTIDDDLDDELPPELQKLVQDAMEDIDKRSILRALNESENHKN